MQKLESGEQLMGCTSKFYIASNTTSVKTFKKIIIKSLKRTERLLFDLLWKDILRRDFGF